MQVTKVVGIKGVLVSLFFLLAACQGQNTDLVATKLIDAAKSQRPPTPSPTPDQGPGPTGKSNAKVIFKNPLYRSPQTSGYVLRSNSQGQYSVTPSSAINYDHLLIDVEITETRNGLLENQDFSVLTETANGQGQMINSGLQRAKPDAQGRWLFSSVGDSHRRLGQLMAYYWIHSQKQAFEGILPNSWHCKQRGIKVYSSCYDINGSFSQSQGLGPNAFWAGSDANLVCMSYLGPFESSYDASVYDHEMGHANIDYGTNGQIVQGRNYGVGCRFSRSALCCSSADGCAGAINEGQADVHSYIVFNSGALGEFFTNTSAGLEGRNAELNGNLTAQAMFNGTAIDPASQQAYGQYGPEIHLMGGVWGAAWWTLRNRIGSKNADKIFLAHLELLTGNDSFKTALGVILTAHDQLLNQGNLIQNFRSDITASFSKHGIVQ
ncbi:MAG: hypothetical protein IT289_05040 [Oligoflexia bacterium]|nr:hypothetical protein [Oligoflexia bacterium]